MASGIRALNVSRSLAVSFSFSCSLCLPTAKMSIRTNCSEQRAMDVWECLCLDLLGKTLKELVADPGSFKHSMFALGAPKFKAPRNATNKWYSHQCSKLLEVVHSMRNCEDADEGFLR